MCCSWIKEDGDPQPLEVALKQGFCSSAGKNPPAMRETSVRFLGQEDPLEKGKATHSSILGFPGGSAGKESACNAGDLDSILGLESSSGEGNGYPFQYSGLENSMDWIVPGVAKSRTILSDFHFHQPLGSKAR